MPNTSHHLNRRLSIQTRQYMVGTKSARNFSIDRETQSDESRYRVAKAEIFENDWEELVIKFDKESGQYVVSVASEPLADDEAVPSGS